MLTGHWVVGGGVGGCGESGAGAECPGIWAGIAAKKKNNPKENNQSNFVENRSGAHHDDHTSVQESEGAVFFYFSLSWNFQLFTTFHIVGPLCLQLLIIPWKLRHNSRIKLGHVCVYIWIYEKQH